MSFIQIIENIKTTLETDVNLAAFSTAKWGKALTVHKVYKSRTEISLSDLPVVLITRPSTEKSYLVGGREWNTMVRLYCGFHQTDRFKALEEFIEFEEKIEDALLVDPRRGDNALDTDPERSVNDEGKYHPVYFLVMDVRIETERDLNV